MSRKEISEKGWCVYCGIQAPSGAVFCPRCGEPLDPSYVYGESVSSEETPIEETEETGKSYEITSVHIISSTPSRQGTQVLYEGIIRGLVTGESKLIRTPVEWVSNIIPPPSPFLPKPHYGFDACLVIKLEGFEGVPDEILVYTPKFGYFRKGDKVTLQGKIIKEYLKQWSKPKYTIFANHFYNESLHIGDEDAKSRKQVFYEGKIQGSVTIESRPRFVEGSKAFGTDFFMKLEENIGIEGVPEEILVHTVAAGFFRIGDKIILQGKIVDEDLESWGRPMYAIIADHFYNESLQIGDEELTERKYILYQGTIQGMVTKESASSFIKSASSFIKGRNFIESYFVMKLEKDIGFAGMPDEILVHINTQNRFGVAKSSYFGMGDKVILKGKIIKRDLSQWGRPMYVIEADHFYNESLQIGDERLMERTYVLDGITIRGLVTRESRSTVKNDENFVGIHFAVKLEENIGIEGVPEEILVSSHSPSYFGMGDKVILKGKIFKINLELWGRPMYVIEADHFYNESLQIGD